ncbi:Cadherin domain protein [Rosistilla ulvae]|uniref:Cadherin domain protein n=2 Tax=Rosistilla ulvae TaxID=1930277 RepID=A0A517LYB9_9BACT|nr:Cadherin domain protein [Rosistilla ulvae]
MRLEDRILYSAVPMVDHAEVQAEGASDAGEPADLVASPTDSTASAEGNDSPDDVIAFDVEMLASAADDPAVRNEIVFIDAAVDDLDALLEDLFSSGDHERDIEVVLLEAGDDGIDRISEHLERRSGLDAVHIISHGDGQGIQLGAARLDSRSAEAYAGQIASWAGALDVDADLMIYGCDLASSSAGQDLLASIAALCDCDVAASEDITGNSELGGDWDLEYRVGAIEAEVAISATAQVQWQHTLDFSSPSGGSIWLSTKDDANGSGFGGNLFVDESDVLELVDPGVRFGDDSGGSVDNRMNLNAFSSLKATLNAMHVVGSDQTVGGTFHDGIDLKAGDLLFSTETSVTLTSLNSVHVNEHDLVLFSPTAPGDYSSGTFTILLDDLPSGPLQGITLVEHETLIGDYTVSAGDFLFISSLADKQIRLYETEDVGANTSGTVRVLLDVSDTNVAIDSAVYGIELIETDTQVGGFSLTAGQILLTTDGDGEVGQNALWTTRQDIFAMDVSQTTLVAGADSGVATTALFFDGSDMFLDSTSESLDAIALYSSSSAPTNITLTSTAVDENTDTSVGYTMATLTSSDPDPGDTASFSIVGGADQAKFTIDGSDRLVLTDGILDFENQSTYMVTVRATDSDGLYSEKLLTIDVNDINEAPMVTAIASDPNFVENGSAVVLFGSTDINPIDTGDQITSLQFSVDGLQNGEHEILHVDGDTIVLIDEFTATTLANRYDVAVNVVGGTARVSVSKTGSFTTTSGEELVDSLRYENKSESPRGASREIALIYIQDDGGTADGGDDDRVVEIVSTVTLTAVNDEQALTTNAVASVAEGSTGNVLNNMLLETTDVDHSAAVLIYTIVTDAEHGALRRSGVVLATGDTFSQADIDAGWIHYDHDGSETTTDHFTFTVDDGIGTNTAASFHWTIAPVNDNSVSAIVDSDASAASVYEAADVGTAVGITALANDADVGDEIMYRLDDDAEGRFAIDPVTGKVTVADGSRLNFEASRSHDIEIRATSTDGSFQTQTFRIAVENVNEAPQITGLDGGVVSAFNNGTTTRLDALGNASLFDPESPADYSDAVLSVQGIGFTADDLLVFDTAGAVTLSVGIADGSTVSVDGTLMATLSATSNAGLTLTFDGNATADEIETILQSVSFQSSSDTLGDRRIELTFNDGDGAANGGDPVSSTIAVTVSVALAPPGDRLVTTAEDVAYIFAAADFDHTPFAADSEATIEITRLPAEGMLTLSGRSVVLGEQITQADLAAGRLEFVPEPDGNGELYASFEYNVYSSKTSMKLLAGEPNSFTLNGGSLGPTDAILANPGNFGPTEIWEASVSVVPASATIDAAYLAQGDVLFNGFVPDANWTADEMAALETWIQAGGIFIVNSDTDAYDRVSFHFGLAIAGSGNSVWHVDDSTHPIMDGPFGAVGNAGTPFQATGAIGYFDRDSLAIGDQVLATDSVTGEPTLVVRQHGEGWILFSADEGIFRAGMTGDGTIATANDILVANIFAWAADQLTETSSYQTNIEVEAVNDAPLNLGGLPGALLGWEDRSIDVDLSAMQLTDIDSATSELTLTLSTQSAGTLSALSGWGVTVAGGDGTSVSLIGTADALNAFLADRTRVQFTATNDAVGIEADAIHVELSDGGGVSATVDLGIVKIDVVAVNDPPQLVTNLGAMVTEGAIGNSITQTMLAGSDVDNADAGLVYTLTEATQHGTLTLLGFGDLRVSDTFTQADIDAGRILYSHDGSETLEDAFRFLLSDDGADGVLPTLGRFVFTILPSNDHTTTAIVDRDASADVVLENAAIGSRIGVRAFAADGDLLDTIFYRLDDNDGGRFMIDALSGVVRVAGPIDRENDGPSRSITIRATSSDGSYQTLAVAIAIADVNEFDVGPITDVDAATDRVEENAEAGTLVGFTATAFDRDATDNAVQFTLSDDAGGRFEIDATTGEIRVADGAVLDFESNVRHNVVVVASGSDGSTSTRTIAIALEDVDEPVGNLETSTPKSTDEPSAGTPVATGSGTTNPVLPTGSETDDDSDDENDKILAPPPVVDENDEREGASVRRGTGAETLVLSIDETDDGLESGPTFQANVIPADRSMVSNTPQPMQLLHSAMLDPLGNFETFDFNATSLTGSLDRFAEGLADEDASLQLVAGTASCLFAGASVGVALWAINSTALVGFMSAAVPAWARFDPIYIVRDGVASKDDDDLSIAGIITQSSHANCEAKK